MKWAPPGVSTTPSVSSRLMHIVWSGPSDGDCSVVDDRSVVTNRRSAAPRNSSSKKGSGPRIWPDPGGVGPVDVDEGGVQPERRHGHQLLAVVVGRATVRSEGLTTSTSDPSPARVGRKGSRCEAAEQAQVEHPLVDLHGLDGSGLAGRLEVGVGGDRVEGHEAVDDLGHLARRAQQPDVGAAVGDDGEVGEVRAEDGPHRGHRLAPRAPAADADGHARCELGDQLVEGQPLVSHGRSCLSWAHADARSARPSGPVIVVVSASRFSTKAARCSSATPATWSS